MASRLVTFLGKGEYSRTTYVLDDQTQETCYVALALTKFLGCNEILVLSTNDAWEKHSHPFTEAFASSGLPRPVRVEIAAGSTNEELWGQFQQLYEALRCEGPVALDITHGFRVQPFFAAAVVQFFQSVHRDANHLNVYYGAFDGRDSALNHTPIWDLTAFVELLRWSRAVLLFLRTGRAEDIGEPTERLGRELQKRWALGGKQGSQPSLAALGKAIQEFGDDFATIRTAALISDPRSSSQRLLDALERAATDITKYLPPLASVLTQVEDLVRPLAHSPRLSERRGQEALQALANTYLSMGRYAEAAATLREGWITRYACTLADRPGTDHYSNAHREAAEKCWFEADEDLAKTLCELRNDIEHAGFRPHPKPPQTIKNQLKRMIDRWCNLDQAAPAPVVMPTQDSPIGSGHEPPETVFYSIAVDHPITPDEPLPPLPHIPRGALVVIEGRAPIWRYGLAFHRLHGSPAAAVAVYDPRLGAVVVATHSPQFADGQILDLHPPQGDQRPSGPH